MYKSDINSVEYGQGTSVGFSILGDGLGLMLRRTLKSEDQIGLGTHFFLSFVQNAAGTSIDRVNPGVFFRTEYNFHLGNTYKEIAKRSYVKRKFKKHYISVKAGAALSEFNVYSFVLSWHRESFRVKNKLYARGLDLGVAYNFIPNDSANLFTNTVGVYFRLDWTWFRHNKNK